MFTLADLIRHQHKGSLNGNWRRLSFLDKAFFKACVCYTKLSGKIVNSKIVAELTPIIEKLTSTLGKKIFMTGLKKSRELLLKFEEKEVFNWVPESRGWLKDSRYIFWLGLVQQDMGLTYG